MKKVSELAVYDDGEGPPVLLMPSPHAFTVAPSHESPLARLLRDMGLRTITFDPPGAYRSTRPPRLGMGEMLDGAEEALDRVGVTHPVDTVGHSTAGLCALALAIERPRRVASLLLVGAVSGIPAVYRHRGMPFCWRPWQLAFWRFVVAGLRMRWGRSNLAAHRRLANLVFRASYRDRSLAPTLPIEPSHRWAPVPPRAAWADSVRKLDYVTRLDAVAVPTLVCVGAHDPQAPVAASRELADGIPMADLVVFSESGHYPHVEEPVALRQAVERFRRRAGAARTDDDGPGVSGTDAP